MKKYTIYFIFLILISCNRSEIRYVKYESNLFSVEYPENWEVDTSGPNELKLVLLSPQNGNRDPFRENCNVVFFRLTDEQISLEEYHQSGMSHLLENRKPKILINQKISHSSGECYQLKFEDLTKNKLLKFLQFNWVKNGIVYVLTFTAEANRYEEYEGIFEKMFLSFKLK